MGVNATGHNSYTLDAEELIHSGTVTGDGVGTVATVAQVVDFGGTDVNSVENVAYTPCQLVIDTTAMFRTGADQVYQLLFQLADDDPDFSAATVVWNRAQLNLGEEVGTNTVAQDATVIGRVTLGVDNEMMGTLFRYARIIHLISGTTPSLSYQAYLARNK
jgi:hypothetical protein